MFKKQVVLVFGALFTLNVFAEDLYAPVIPQDWSSIITISGGPAWSDPGRDQYLYLYPPPMVNYYIADSESDLLGTGEIFFGLQRFIGVSNIIGQLGIGVAGAGDAYLSGVVSINGISNVSSYQYRVSHFRTELKGKLIANGFQPVQPYLSGSLGVAWNYSHDYISTSIDPVLFPAYWLSNRSVVSFSYTLGLGLQTMLTPHWQVGVGAEFADWGGSNLGGDENRLHQGLSMTHLYTTELLFSLSYVF